MNAIPQQVVTSQKAAIDTLVAYQSTLFSGFEKLVDLNLKVMRASLDEAAQKSQQVSELRDGKDAAAFSSNMMQPNAEKALAYSKHVYDIVAGVQSELAALADERITAGQKTMVDVVEQLSRNAPAGSEGAVALFKSSLATANNAYESISAAAKQAAEVAETNMNAAANATFSAASDVADAAKSSSRGSRRAA